MSNFVRPRIVQLLASVAVLTLAAADLRAADEYLWFSSTSSGTISANLNGNIPYCDARLGGFNGSPHLSISGDQISVTSDVFAGDCGGSPPQPVPPVPYTLSIELGHVTDGTYNVTWSFIGTSAHQTFSARFTVAGGVLVNSVPCLSPTAIVLLGCLLVACGAASIRVVGA